MSASHCVANSAKRQFFRPNQFANDRGSVLLRDLAGHALAQLIGGWMRSPKQLGCWAGDPLFIVRDSGSDWSAQLWPKTLPGDVEDFEVLCSMYTDVTYPVIAGLGHRDDLAEEFIQRAWSQRDFLSCVSDSCCSLRCSTSSISVFQRFRQRLEGSTRPGVETELLVASARHALEPFGRKLERIAV